MEVRPGPVYRVEITEYEAGWGQRVYPSDTKYFTTYQEALEYKSGWEQGGSPECYWRAHITKIS